MLSEITAGLIGAVAGLGGMTLMLRFLNAKIDKKQDRSLCENIAKNFAEGLHRGEEKFDKIMETLVKIQVANGAIKKELEHLNRKSP